MGEEFDTEATDWILFQSGHLSISDVPTSPCPTLKFPFFAHEGWKLPFETLRITGFITVNTSLHNFDHPTKSKT